MSADYADKPWLQHYDDGVPHQIDVPQHPLHGFLKQSASAYPQQTATIFRGARLSYRQLDQLTDDLAAALALNGFRKGDRAVIYMPNTPQFVIAYYGIMKAGGIVIATNPLYSERELEHQLADCGAETVFVMSLFYDQLKRVQQKGNTNVKRVVVTNVKEYFPAHLKLLFTLVKEKKDGHRIQKAPADIWFQDFLASGRQAPAIDVQVTGDDVALLQYTGGTTGLAKGAIGLHRNLVANTLMLKAWLPDLEPGKETVLTALPLYHSYGMNTTMNLAVATGGAMVLIVNPRDLDDLLGSINKYRPSLFPGLPALYIAINNHPDVQAGKYDLSSIRACISGSAPLLLDTKQRFEALTGGKLVEGYGLTEAHVATHANPVNGQNKPGIGIPMPGIEAKIVDPEDSDRLLPVGEIGELAVKGPCIMAGYWHMPTETANVLRDGWLYTGDIARMDEEGYFYIEDRKKDMIIASGYNIYPREVEEVLTTHPDVLEVAVAGVPHEKRGETVKAWVVKKPGSTLTEQELIEWSKERLARYKYPRMIEFRDQLPRTTVGKVLKRDLVQDTVAA